MSGAGYLLAKLCSRLGHGFTLLALALWATPATAATLDVERDICHAASGTDLPDTRVSMLRFSCDGAPTGYQQGSLWLRVRLDGADARRGDVALMVHHSRFDRLAVAFSHADGATRWQQVRAGD